MRKRFVLHSLGLSLAVLFLTQNVCAGTLRGTVNNGTTSKPAANVEVVLLQLQGGMTPVGTTKTDANGQFTFDHAGVGAQPMLVRAIYKGVNFHQPLPPGKDSVTVEVFEPTQDGKVISVPSHVVIFQPNSSSLTVGEEYEVKNAATPPQAYYKSDGNFEVTLPANADLKQIAASGPSGMPVVQAPIDKGKGRYAIAFAFRPGESDVRLSYELPYPNNSTTVKLPMTFGGGRLLVVAPPGVQLTGDGLQMAGQEQGMNVYERSAVTAGSVVTVLLNGTAPPPSPTSAGADAGGAPGRAENVQGGENGPAIQAIPGRLDALKWPLIGGFGVLFVLAAFYLARKPVAMMVPVETETVPAAQKAKISGAQQPAAPANGDALASLDRATSLSLDALKDQLFRLELRHQAGTISEEDYARDRAKAEQVLRDLVRG
ncbi:MAG TPA: carboxypeptidase-like regulatory domain-containing protein [Candidatus Acidoferrum sp.]|nr:carboxypeptidase-like regulatory domain-containing protein [Candidatus Acidoferrum sp.]